MVALVVVVAITELAVGFEVGETPTPLTQATGCFPYPLPDVVGEQAHRV